MRVQFPLPALFLNDTSSAPTATVVNKISEEEWEAYFLAENGEGLVDAHEQHVERVAEILSDRHPGLIFLWDTAYQGKCTITVVKPDKRKIAAARLEKIMGAAEAIAENVANKHPVKQLGFFARLSYKPLPAGWYFTPEKK